MSNVETQRNDGKGIDRLHSALALAETQKKKNSDASQTRIIYLLSRIKITSL